MLRENVMLIVRDYNNIIVLIDDRERKLFDEHITYLNKMYDPGFRKHQWSTNQDAFMINCRKECGVQQAQIKFFQTKHRSIEKEISRIQNQNLINIRKQVYELNSFVSDQKTAMKNAKRVFEDSFQKIRNELKEMYSELFYGKGPDIQKEWLHYVEETSNKLKKAL